MKKSIKYNLHKELRLDKFLKQKLPDFSRTKIQKYIKSGIVKVDGYNIKPSYLLKFNQIISLDNDINSINEELLLPEDMELNILYEDDDIIAINKKAGIVVHPGIGNKSGTLLNGVLHHCSNLSNFNGRPGVIHRLDKGTSGVIIFAKNDQAHYHISEQFANRSIKKKYLAITWGNIDKILKVDGYINRDPKNRLKFKLNRSKGKFSLSQINPVSNYDLPISVVEVYPTTGRTHQIRVHLSYIGHPILKDDLYNGGDKIISSFHQKYKIELVKIINLIDRVALHANEIEFMHPKNHKKINLVAPMPRDFCDVHSFLNE